MEVDIPSFLQWFNFQLDGFVSTTRIHIPEISDTYRVRTYGTARKSSKRERCRMGWCNGIRCVKLI